MIVHCRYLFIKPNGEIPCQSTRWSPALFNLHFSLGNTVMEVMDMAGQVRYIREILPEYVAKFSI